MSDPQVHHGRTCEQFEQDPYLFALRLYVQYLQGLFNFMPAGEWHWEPDDEVSEIVIRGEAPIDSSVIGKKPAITVVMGPVSFAGIGIDNMMSYDMNTDKRTRSDLMSGHLVVYTLAESDIIAMRLAHLVAHYTRVNQRLLESRGGFFQIARPAPIVNTPSPPGALVSGDPVAAVMVQVNIPFQLQWTWSTEPRQPPGSKNLDLITKYARASDFPYTSPAKLEKVQLALSTTPVLVRRISGSDAQRPRTIEVTTGIKNFRRYSLRPFGD